MRGTSSTGASIVANAIKSSIMAALGTLAHEKLAPIDVILYRKNKFVP
jgi:hypothetical protein